MKRLLLILTLILSSKLYAADQKSMMYGQAAANVGASATTTIAGIEYLAVCTAGGPLASVSCLESGLAFTTAAVTAGAAVLSVVAAQEMDGSSGNTPLPSSVNIRDLTTPDGDPIKTPGDLQRVAEDQRSVANQKLADLKARGYDMEKFLAHPEAFGVSKEELKQMQSKVDQISSQGKSLEPEKTMSANTEEASSGTEYFRDIASADASVSVSEMEHFNFDTLFSSFMPNKALENSAPGYYGNVSLKVLNPASKLSLFERVSLKLKKLM